MNQMYQMQQQRPAQAYGAVSSAALLGQVLGITGVGFIVTAIAAYICQGVSPMVGVVAMIAGFVLLMVMNGVRRQQGLALMLFYAFTFLEGVGLAPTISRYVMAVGGDVVFNAAATTGLGMFCLAMVSYTFSFDWRKLQSFAFAALIGLVVVGVLSMFVHFIQPGTYAWLTLAVFTLLTLIDFSRIRAGGQGLTAVDLAISIYLDAINIFLALLSIFGGRRSND